jgi:ATP-binding cassette ChvD family protein
MAAYQYVYVMKRLAKVYPGGKKVLDDIWLSFLPGAKIGVLGLNGSGKSTLLKIMSGRDPDTSGEHFLAEGATCGLLEQEPHLDPKKTVAENVMEGLGSLKSMVDRFEDVSNKLGEVTDDDEMNALLAEQAELQEKIDAADAWDLNRTIEIAMDALRCPPGDTAVTKLSGGERRRVALCRLLLQKPDLLLLDEPTNHLDAESVGWLERFLHDYPGCVVAVTHDRYFLDNVAGWILELDRGKGIPWEGNYSSWLDQKQKRLALEEKQETNRQKTLERELEWIKSSPRARQAKNKARIQAYDALVAEERDRAPDSMQIQIAPGPRLGNTVVVAEQLSKGFGDKLLIDKLDFRLPAGGIVGIIGPNGAGKTTLFRMLVGQDKPDSQQRGQDAKAQGCQGCIAKARCGPYPGVSRQAFRQGQRKGPGSGKRPDCQSCKPARHQPDHQKSRPADDRRQNPVQRDPPLSSQGKVPAQTGNPGLCGPGQPQCRHHKAKLQHGPCGRCGPVGSRVARGRGPPRRPRGGDPCARHRAGVSRQ